MLIFVAQFVVGLYVVLNRARVVHQGNVLYSKGFYIVGHWSISVVMSVGFKMSIINVEWCMSNLISSLSSIARIHICTQ